MEEGGGGTVRAALAAVFFLSGAAALLFESLWFRQTLLAFGSSVQASSLVLSSFMAGLALGNAAAARFGTRVRRPILVYALLELAVGALGIGLVLVLPRLGPLLAPVFGPLLGTDALLQPLRFAFGFVLLLGPAAAMGATLPLLVRVLSRRSEDFGRTLAALYGWNTLGAVFGAVAGEVWLLSPLGVVWTAAVAAGLNFLAAVGAFAVIRLRPEADRLEIGAGEAAVTQHGDARRTARLLLAAFLSGGLLLGLQVVWIRLLVLFVAGTSRAFAVMLAVVLAGIALGSLGASVWMGRARGADRHVWAVALAAGAIGMLGYGQLGIALQLGELPRVVILSPRGLLLATTLMLPVSAASGVLFTLLGKALNDSLRVPVRSAGILTLVNTLGAAIGPVIAGFVLLPWLGVERSIFLLCASYGAVALLGAERAALRAARPTALAAVVYVAAVATFPFGRMNDRYIPFVTKPSLMAGAEIVAQREGLIETIQLGRLSFLDEPLSYQLITNGYAMSATTTNARRYMNLFVHLPVALHPGPRDALLISYGVGNTARSLTRVEGLRSIDIVDISRDILDLSKIVFQDGAENPLDDPRVTVHVEDGRYFLQTTNRSFDLITAEPPPPNNGHVTYLYTQEYFQLAHDRLRPGGLLSYWLPVDQLQREETASITGAFCAVFEDCSLWNGGGLNWILLGSRGGIAPLDAEAFARQWRNRATAADLRAIGVESPESLGALFIADSGQLRALTDLAPPVRDAYPLRIYNWTMPTEITAAAQFQNDRECRRRFLRSAWVKRVWPEALRRETLGQFRTTGIVELSMGHLATPDESLRLRLLRELLETSTLETVPLLVMRGDPMRVAIAERRQGEMAPSSQLELTLAQAALVRREWSEAAAHYSAAVRLGAQYGRPRQLAVYAHCRAGELAEVETLRRDLFDDEIDRDLQRDVKRHPGIDGCWAAAWDPDWQRM